MQFGAVRLEPSAPLEDHVAAARGPTSPSSRAAGARRRSADGSRSPSGSDGRRRRAARPRSDAVEPVRVAEQAQPLATRQAGEAPALGLARRGAAAPRSSPPRRRRRGAAPARRSPSRRARPGRPSRRITFGGKTSLWQTTSPPRGDAGRRIEWLLVPVGRRLEAGLRVVHPPDQRAERVQGLVVPRCSGSSAGSPSTYVRTSPSALVDAEDARRSLEADLLEVAEERVTRSRCAARPAGARCRRRARRRSRRR